MSKDQESADERAAEGEAQLREVGLRIGEIATEAIELEKTDDGNWLVTESVKRKAE